MSEICELLANRRLQVFVVVEGVVELENLSEQRENTLFVGDTTVVPAGKLLHFVFSRDEKSSFHLWKNTSIFHHYLLVGGGAS